MVTVTQYPHTGIINGVSVKGRWEYQSNKTIKDFNGQDVVVNGIFYTQADISGVKKGVNLTVKDENDQLIITGAVLQKSKGQLNKRLWM